MKHLFSSFLFTLTLLACGAPLEDKAEIDPNPEKAFTLLTIDGTRCLDFSGTYRSVCTNKQKLILTLEQTSCESINLYSQDYQSLSSSEQVAFQWTKQGTTLSLKNELALQEKKVAALAALDIYQDRNEIKGKMKTFALNGDSIDCDLEMVIHARENRNLD